MSSAIVVNKKRLWWVFATLLDAWRRKLPPYDRVKQVPERIPFNVVPGSVGHALFLFCALQFMRGRINSQTALLALSRLYEDRPYLFRPSYYGPYKGLTLRARRTELRQILPAYGLGFNAGEVARFWVFNLIKIHRFWEGNPILLIEKTNSYDELCEVLIGKNKNLDNPHGFYGIRHKMVSMLVYFYARAGIVDPYEHPPPHDFHHCRVVLSTEALAAKGPMLGAEFSFEKLGEVLRPLSLEFCEGDVEKALDLADALWHLSRTFCLWNIGNMSHQGEYRARSTEVRARSESWTEALASKFYNTCEICPVRDECRWNIPSARQYVSGKISIRRRRVIHPQLEVFARSDPKPRNPLPIIQAREKDPIDLDQLDFL